MRTPLFVCAVIALAAAAGGCRKEAPSQRAPTPRAANEPAPAQPSPAKTMLAIGDLDAIGKASKAHRMALVVKTRNNPFFDPMIKAAEAEAKALGVALEVQAPPQESDKERQFALVQDVTARGVDAILIAPADSKGIVPALKQA